MHSQIGLCHGHWVGDYASDTTRGALEIYDLGSFIWLPAVHRRLVRCSLLLLELNVSSDIVRLAAQECLPLLLCVDDWSVKTSHIGLAKNKLAQIVAVLLPLFCKRGALSRFGPIHFLGLEKHFVESRHSIGRSSGEDAVLVRNCGSRVFDNCVNLSGNEKDSLNEVIF